MGRALVDDFRTFVSRADVYFDRERDLARFHCRPGPGPELPHVLEKGSTAPDVDTAFWPSPHTGRNPRWLRRSHLRHTAILLYVPHHYKNKRVPAQLNNLPKEFVTDFYCSSQNYLISP